MTSPQALVVSGGGRFTDPWHPFADTSAELAAALEARGYHVTVDDDADASLAALAENPLPSLLVLNIGWRGPDQFLQPAAEALVAALGSGLPTLLAHSTLTAFPDWPLWHQIAGGGWTRGITYHPDYAPGVALAVSDHPLGAGLDQLQICDERYTDMWVDEKSSVFVEHQEDGRRHALGWTRSWGASPIVADALGHDAAAYRATGRQQLLQRELEWLQQHSPAVTD